MLACPWLWAHRFQLREESRAFCDWVFLLLGLDIVLYSITGIAIHSVFCPSAIRHSLALTADGATLQYHPKNGTLESISAPLTLSRSIILVGLRSTSGSSVAIANETSLQWSY